MIYDVVGLAAMVVSVLAALVAGHSAALHEELGTKVSLGISALAAVVTVLFLVVL